MQQDKNCTNYLHKISDTQITECSLKSLIKEMLHYKTNLSSNIREYEYLQLPNS